MSRDHIPISGLTCVGSMERKEGRSKLKVAIIHPDLGIGGAERLIVDAAVELASHGHNVHVFTSHHDPTRCFEETLAGQSYLLLLLFSFWIRISLAPLFLAKPIHFSINSKFLNW